MSAKKFPKCVAVAGIDEAGRGPLAGPVTAACVVLPCDVGDLVLDDSKRLSPEEREAAFEGIVRKAVAYSIVSVGHRRIEKLNIREATRLAMLKSAQRVYTRLCCGRSRCYSGLYLLIDGDMTVGPSFPCEAIVKGDQKIAAISAASILAKVARDRLMVLLNSRYPGYGFDKHKGYATRAHYDGLQALGPCPVHRRTFAGVKELIIGQESASQLELVEV